MKLIRKVGSDRRRRVLLLATAALLALLLVFASEAAAETWTGETSTVERVIGTPAPEAAIVHASGSYDLTSGSVILKVATGAEPQVEHLNEKSVLEPNATKMYVYLLKMPVPCSLASYEEYAKSGLDPASFAEAIITSEYSQPTLASGLLDTVPAREFAVTKSVAGTTSTLEAQDSGLSAKGFGCVIVQTAGFGAVDIMSFALVPPPAVLPSPPAPTPPAPAPSPAALSIAGLKPLTLKAGKSKAVKVKVTNDGGTTTSPGSLRVKRAPGVLVKPERQQVPVLLPGASITLSVHVQVTTGAKAKSTLSFTGAAPGATGANGSLVVKVQPQQ